MQRDALAESHAALMEVLPLLMAECDHNWEEWTETDDRLLSHTPVGRGRAALTGAQERHLKSYVEGKGMIFLGTPFSRAAAERLEAMGVQAYKIGSGECNNYPLVRHIASYHKPVLLSTGMNDLDSIRPAVDLLREAGVPYGLMHCTSIYPTPYDKVRLGALTELARAFPDAVLGLSDHSLGNYTCFAAVALGASVIEKHFTSDKTWSGPDIPISIDPIELGELIEGTKAVFLARGGGKSILPDERVTSDFAYASVVAIEDITAGDELTAGNIWVKRPGTGEIAAADYDTVLGRFAAADISRDTKLRWADLAPRVERVACAAASDG